MVFAAMVLMLVVLGLCGRVAGQQVSLEGEADLVVRAAAGREHDEARCVFAGAAQCR